MSKVSRLRGRSPHFDKMQKDLQKELPSNGFLHLYLNMMRNENAEGAEELMADVIDIFSTEEGLRVLKLFEKSVLHTGVPNGSSDGALRELNAVRNFVLEIRNIVAHGT